MGASEGDISMFNSLNLRLVWLGAGVDAQLEWQWNGGHVPTEVLGESFSLYVDQMYGKHVEGTVSITKPLPEKQTANGSSEAASNATISSWVSMENGKVLTKTNHNGGVLGGILTTIGLVAPSVIIVYIVYGFLKKFRDSFIVNSLFNGIRPAVTGLIGAVWLGLLSHEVFKEGISLADSLNFKAILLFIALFALVKKTDKHPLFYIAIAAVVGVVFGF